VWERTSPKDFVQEAFVLPFLLLILGFHVWGTRKNRSKAKAWATMHGPILNSEFAVVGFGGIHEPAAGEVTGSELVEPEKLLKEKSAQEFQSYATGRQNVAFLDVTIKLLKRYNPIVFVLDYVLSLFFESFPPPVERYEATIYTFDGKEKDLVPVPAGDTSSIKVPNSTYDGFIWAVAHKNVMRQLRQDRYDASLTFTKDNAKLPGWATIMTESAEITDHLLTPELAKAIEQAGDMFECLIITDQPLEKPLKYVMFDSLPPRDAVLMFDLTGSRKLYPRSVFSSLCVPRRLRLDTHRPFLCSACSSVFRMCSSPRPTSDQKSCARSATPAMRRSDAFAELTRRRKPRNASSLQKSLRRRSASEFCVA
jgi:hypothetical protein